MIISPKRVAMLVFLTLLAAASWIKVSFIIGAHTGFFSLSHCLTPLCGLVSGIGGLLTLFLVKTALHTYAAHTGTALLLGLHLPTLCAGLYCRFALRSTPSTIARWLFLAIPVLCMVLFTVHPVGSQAYAYSFFWIIPVIALCIPHQNFFFYALGSTFTAHAVGSVLWLYAGLVPNPAAWLALIPVVIVERCMMASGMTLSYYFLRALTDKITQAFSKTASNPLTVQ